MALIKVSQMMHSQNLPKPSAWRVAAALVPGLLLGAAFILAYGPIPQPLSYHNFAGNRVFLSIPHAGDVLTNLVFFIVGSWGLWFLTRPELSDRAFIDSRERRLFQWFFMAVFLTAFC